MEIEEKEIEEEEMSIAKETMQMCKILYCQKDLPMTKTCMCWGWECNKGWYEILRRLSCELESLNLLFYDKYKVRIQADQVKEKFGTLRFYYSVMCDNYNSIGLEAKKVIDEFEEKSDNGYFGLKTVVDEKGHTADEVDENGKKHAVWHPPKAHFEATKHADEYKSLNKAASDARNTLYENGYDEITSEQKVIMSYLDSEANARIKKAEDDCYNTCERCGMPIGTDYSPRCETSGWITYICDKCASKTDNAGRTTIYYKNGAMYDGETLIKTKEQVKAEHDAFEKRLRHSKLADEPAEEICTASSNGDDK